MTVPDLTFSEMNFLKSRKDQSNAISQQAGSRTKRHKKDKTADTEAEISRYFTLRAPRTHIEPESGHTENLPDAVSPTEDSRHDARHVIRPRLPPVELPDRPFLGFGSSGLSLTSPTKPNRCHDSPPQGFQQSSERRASVLSTSYYTWSPSTNPVSRSQTSRDSTHTPELLLQYPQTSKVRVNPDQVTRISISSASSTAAIDNGMDNRGHRIGHNGRKKYLGDITRSEANNYQQGRKRKLPQPWTFPSETPNVATREALFPSIEPVIPKPQVSSQSPTDPNHQKADPEEKAHIEPVQSPTDRNHQKADPQKKAHIEPVQSPRRGSWGSGDRCKESDSFDVVLEDILNACREGFELSTPSLDTLCNHGHGSLLAPLEDSNPHGREIEQKTPAFAIETKSANPRENSINLERQCHTLEAQDPAKHPTETEPTPSTYTCLQQRQYNSSWDPMKTTALGELFPRAALDHSESSSINRKSTTGLNNSYENHTSLSGAWNAYENIYEKQMYDSSRLSHSDDDELWRPDSRTGQVIPDTQSQEDESLYLDPSTPRGFLTCEHFDEIDAQRNEHDTLEFQVTRGQRTSPGNQEALPRNTDDWTISVDETIPNTSSYVSQLPPTYVSHTMRIADGTMSPLFLAASPERASTINGIFVPNTTETSTFGETASTKAHDHYNVMYRDVEPQSDHSQVDTGESLLSSFWKPNKLY